MTTIKPDFRDKYGREYEYANPEVNKQVFVGIIWYLWQDKVHVWMSRPYDSTGPARAWVTRAKKERKSHNQKVLDCNVLTQYGWAALDTDRLVLP